jgi:hypothetical protein
LEQQMGRLSKQNWKIMERQYFEMEALDFSLQANM